MRASAYNQEVARLLGVRVGRMLTLGWALASLVGSLAGLLIAGGSLVHPATWTRSWSTASSPPSSAASTAPSAPSSADCCSGVSLSFVSGYVGSELVALAALADPDGWCSLLRPGGLFAQAAGAEGLSVRRLTPARLGLDPRPAPAAGRGRAWSW